MKFIWEVIKDLFDREGNTLSCGEVLLLIALGIWLVFWGAGL